MPASEIVKWALSAYAGDFAIATTFQKEDMAILEMAVRIAPDVRVFTLDTGRLPEETLQMIDTTRKHYGIAIDVVYPDGAEVERMVSERGLNLFYESAENRHLCCDVRKLHPLQNKLREFRAWATGLRRQQSATRAAIRKVDEIDGRLRISPLADWTREQVDAYTQEHGIPVHPLYAKGYASIGCAPCTRAIQPGEDERAGRWWWEENSRKECGIHFAEDGSVRRA
jgi:thioredoxin-dependent adenylylsulfate APS reductase